MRDHYGTELTDLRGRLNLSRANLARFLGVAEMTIVRWENGSVSVPRGLPLVVLQALDAACRLHGADAIGRLVKDSAADLGDAIRRLLDLARGVKSRSTLELALRNCLAMAQRMQRSVARADCVPINPWASIARFCAEAGIVPNILREDPSKGGEHE